MVPLRVVLTVAYCIIYERMGLSAHPWRDALAVGLVATLLNTLNCWRYKRLHNEMLKRAQGRRNDNVGPGSVAEAKKEL